MNLEAIKLFCCTKLKTSPEIKQYLLDYLSRILKIRFTLIRWLEHICERFWKTKQLIVISKIYTEALLRHVK
jgi:hypothetical protein